jgi:hypothetical protein
MNFSASELVKKSASQIVYITSKQIKTVITPRQQIGDTYAKSIIKQEKASEEKRGIIKINEDLLYFCIDMVKDNIFTEIKMINGTFEKWYFESSILQATFYATLLSKVKTLDTPQFRLKEGFKQEEIKVPNDFHYQLWFGQEKYEISQNEKVFDFYMDKIKSIKLSLENENYDAVRQFDSDFKHKEFEYLKPEYRKIQN